MIRRHPTSAGRAAARLTGRAAALLVGATVVVSLATGCSSHADHAVQVVPAAAQHDGSIAATPSPAALIASRPSTPGTATPGTATPPASAATQPGQLTPAAEASELDAVTRDLDAIDAGAASTDRELSAGDSARAQDDDG